MIFPASSARLCIIEWEDYSQFYTRRPGSLLGRGTGVRWHIYYVTSSRDGPMRVLPDTLCRGSPVTVSSCLSSDGRGAGRMSRGPKPSLSIVVPTLNEARNVETVLPELPDVHEVLLVDGGSIDGTVETALRVRPDTKVIHQTRRGKGNALACGFQAASGDAIVMFDADGSADPGEIPAFVSALVDGADFAKGSRFRTATGERTPVSAVNRRLRGCGRLISRVHAPTASSTASQAHTGRAAARPSPVSSVRSVPAAANGSRMTASPASTGGSHGPSQPHDQLDRLVSRVRAARPCLPVLVGCWRS